MDVRDSSWRVSSSSSPPPRSVPFRKESARSATLHRRCHLPWQALEELPEALLQDEVAMLSRWPHWLQDAQSGARSNAPRRAWYGPRLRQSSMPKILSNHSSCIPSLGNYGGSNR